MEARELRIGNNVLYNGKVISISPVGLNEIYYLGDSHSKSTSDKREYKPIPLTEEWLLKFGFARWDTGSVSAQFNLGENPVTKDYLIQLIWIKEYMTVEYDLTGYPFYKNRHFEIKYVHRLQNLYHALTGEELEIK